MGATQSNRRDELRLNLEARFIVWYMHAAFTLGSNSYIDETNLDRVMESHGKVLFGIWHGQIMGGVYLMRNRDITAIVGKHRDAELAGRIITRLGYGLIRGSSRDGGRRALGEALQHMERPDATLAITCDGPIGPYREAKPGIAVIAHRTGVPVVPLGVNGTRKKVLTTSWDDFYVHLPFGKNVIIFGEPVYPDADEEPDPVTDLLRDIEEGMHRVQERADGYFGEE